MITVTDMPLNRLVPSAANVRRTHASLGIEELAASIQAHGLLQNLTVMLRSSPRPKSGKAPSYEVIAGGRRLAAMKLLVNRKVMAADAPIPCHVLDQENATEISLAENALQCPMHPADQFDAFNKLHSEKGQSAEDIAASFGVTPAVMKQRLKLAAVSPKLIEAYRQDEMNLDQLTAFAITDDHARQEKVWENCGSRDSRDDILAALFEDHVPAADRCAIFVGTDAYRAAGGTILRDLFDSEGGGFFADADLLDRLVTEKLAAIGTDVEAEGWKWVQVMSRFDHGAAAEMRRLYPQPRALSEDEQTQLTALEEAYAALDDEPDETVAQAEAERLDQAIAALQGEDRFDPADIARAGAFVALGNDGAPRIERGFIRREDDTAGPAAKTRAAKDGPAPLSAALVAELTAHRTFALREALGDQPEFGLIATVHAVAAATFYPHAGEVSCLRISLRSPYLGSHAPGIDEGDAAQRVAARHAAWAKWMPEEPAGLWAFVVGLSHEERLALLTHCMASSIDAVLPHAHQMPNPHIAQLAASVRLDMRQHWQPTAANYLGRVTRERILEAVREGASPQAAENLAKLPKAALVEAAAERLTGKGWLPAILRMPEPDSSKAEPEAVAA